MFRFASSTMMSCCATDLVRYLQLCVKNKRIHLLVQCAYFYIWLTFHGIYNMHTYFFFFYPTFDCVWFVSLVWLAEQSNQKKICNLVGWKCTRKCPTWKFNVVINAFLFYFLTNCPNFPFMDVLTLQSSNKILCPTRINKFFLLKIRSEDSIF